MKHLLVLLAYILISSCTNHQKHVLPSDPIRPNQSFHYHEGISWWDSLSNYSEKLSFIPFGATDASYPLHLAIFSNGEESLSSIKESNKSILLINNAIHPGEPDGVDASMAFYRKLVSDPEFASNFDQLIIVCIPFYNIGGTLNVNSHSRANQNGPEAYGFRGNAQNLDLNRDFVKCDSRNAKSFSTLVQILDPDVYVETHVSNGADYPYVMTYLPTQADKLGYGMDTILRELLNPRLEEAMYKAAFPMVPYVNIHGTSLDSSYTAFYDSPRYSTGMLALRQTFGYITESHMLKPYDERVQATLQFIIELAKLTNTKGDTIQESRKQAKKSISNAGSFPLDWEIDSSRWRTLDFTKYPGKYKTSDVTGAPRLYYDRSSPQAVQMKYYEYMSPTITRTKPKAYLIKAGYHEVIERLQNIEVPMTHLESDSSIEVIQYSISTFETAKDPFEKHYFHYNTSFVTERTQIHFTKGDVVIAMGTPFDRFVVELLEPDGPDSYFNWNFFDAVLQQKEWYSSYVFEDEAANLLASDLQLAASFDSMKLTTPGFADNAQWQLYWIYQQSPHYENAHMRLPIFRIE